MKEKNLKLYKEGIPESDIQKIIKTIEVIGKNPIALGHGMAAKVYTFKDQPFCIKEITNENPKYSFNDTEREMEIQMDVVRMGIRSPYPILILEKEQGRKFVAMETIKGGSLRDVEEKRIVLPKDFDNKSFFDEVAQMVKILHENNLYHRDLHTGNIMFEMQKDKCIPVIIDFGHSSYIYGNDNPYREEDFPRPGKTLILLNDDEQVNM